MSLLPFAKTSAFNTETRLAKFLFFSNWRDCSAKSLKVSSFSTKITFNFGIRVAIARPATPTPDPRSYRVPVAAFGTEAAKSIASIPER